MFDHAGFRQYATQLRDHGDGYAALGLTSFAAAKWANAGFLPDEAADWITAGFDLDAALPYANRFIGPVVAAELVRRAES